MYFAEIGLLFSLLSILLLAFSSWFNVKNKLLNFAPYVSMCVSFGFYHLLENGLEFGYVAIVLPLIAFLHVLPFLDERKKN